MFPLYLQIQKWCDIEYRVFNYSQYPQHVKNLLNYAFKALVIQVSYS